jgi:osmotically-inducible protein OsmY
MKTYRLCLNLLALLLVGTLLGCSTSTKSPDVSDSIRRSLDQAGLQDVSVSQDRDTGVVTLSGQVKSDDEKARAETVAQVAAGNQVVSNQLAVRPVGFESEAKEIDSDLDSGIESNFHAALISNNIDKGVEYDAKNGVLTVKGEVNSQASRNRIEELAASIPYVQQVVNEIQVMGQKATTTP